jgi:hypothetical protein
MKAKELIRVNPLANGGLASQGQQKKRLFQEALKLVEAHTGTIPVADYNEFGTNFKAYVLKHFRQTTKDIVPWFRDEQLFEFMNFETHLLRAIENKWGELRFVEMTPDFQNVIIPDCNPYATTPEELERLKVVRELIKCLEYIANDNVYIDFQTLSRAIPSVLIPTGNKSADPHEKYILKQVY